MEAKRGKERVGGDATITKGESSNELMGKGCESRPSSVILFSLPP